jgi:hypothetical protein
MNRAAADVRGGNTRTRRHGYRFATLAGAADKFVQDIRFTRTGRAG